MGDRTGFVWNNPPKFNQIDSLVSEKWLRMKTLPSKICTDLDFVRRIYLDLTGLPPTPFRVASADSDEVVSQPSLTLYRLQGLNLGELRCIEGWTF